MALSKILHNRAGVSTLPLSASSNCLKTLRDVPKPVGALPLLGHYLQVLRRPGNLSDFLQKNFEELGPIFRLEYPGGKNIVCHADPAGMEAVYRNEGRHPIRTHTGPANFQWFYNKKNLPVPFVFLTGEKWQELRAKHNKQSTPENVHSHIPGFIKATRRLLRNFNDFSTDEGLLEDIHPLMVNWGMEASAYFTFGMDLDFVKAGSLEENQKLQKGFSTLVATIDHFITALPFFKIFPSKVVRKLDEATENLYTIGEKTVRHYLHQENSSGNSLMEQWIREDKMTEKEMIMSAIFMLGAGGETTPINSSYMLYELAKHRDVQEKIYQQVLSVIGETGEVDSEALQKMPYLGQVIKETQRLNPVSPNHIRTLTQDTNVLGYNIPAQTTTMYAMLAVANNEKYFKDPLNFDPDRWGRDPIHPFAILPFGIGPKACWGRRFAEVEMKILLSELCRRYIIESSEPITARLLMKESLFTRPARQVRIKFIPRK